MLDMEFLVVALRVGTQSAFFAYPFPIHNH